MGSYVWVGGGGRGGSSDGGFVYLCKAVPVCPDGGGWDVCGGEAAAASAAALGRRWVIHWGGVTHVAVL